MKVYRQTPFPSRFALLLIFALAVCFLPGAPAALAQGAQSVQLFAGGSEPSTAGANQRTYGVFYDHSVSVTFAGGPVCLSSQADHCAAPAIDDAVRIYVNGNQVFYYESYTHDFGPVDFSSHLQPGDNQVRTQLIDLMGPVRGGSALYLVFASGGGEVVPLVVTVQPGSHFQSVDPSTGNTISIEAQPRATFPFRVCVTRDGQPVPFATLQQKVPFDAYGGETGSEGCHNGSLAVPQPSQSGDFKVVYEATADGVTGSSGVVTLYNVTYEDGWTSTVTEDEARWMPLYMMLRSAADPSVPCPDVSGPIVVACNLLQEIVTLLKGVDVGYNYVPQAGDQLTIEVHSFAGPGITTAYLYHERAVRGGQVIGKLERYYWTEDRSKALPSGRPHHMALQGRLASPATLWVVDPNGGTIGIDPAMGERVFSIPGNFAGPEDEPFLLNLWAPVKGEYTMKTVGTGTGPFTFGAEALDANGNSTGSVETTGLTQPGYVTEFKVGYDPDSAQPPEVTLMGTVDIKPDALNLGSKSDKNAVTAYIELPMGFDVGKIDPASVWLDGVVPAQLLPTAVSDYDWDGIAEVMVKFDRQIVIQYLKAKYPAGGNVTLTVSGVYEAPVKFRASDTIVVMPK